MKKNSLLIVTALLIQSATLFASNIKGKVLDNSTHEQLIGATVAVKGTAQGAITNLDGSYYINNLTSGSYTLVCSYVGFEKQEINITVDGTNNVEQDFLLIEKSHRLQEITIKANDKESDNSARKAEQAADHLMNVVSANTIDLSPDLTVGNVLRRVSGVSIQATSTGHAQYAIVRGMDKRYNYTLLNGIKVPSPDNKNRFVPMDLFPSDMLQKLEVIKSLTPNMEADAIGGVMNLVMKEAPDEFMLKANVGGGYSDIWGERAFSQFNPNNMNKLSPIERNSPSYSPILTDFPLNVYDNKNVKTPVNSLANFVVGNRFLNKKLGVLVAGSYNNSNTGTNSTFFVQNSQPGLNNTPLFSDLELRQYSVNQDRKGAHALVDYEFNKKNKITLTATGINLTEQQTRYYVDSVLAIQRTGPGSGNVEEHYRNRYTTQSIANTTLRGEHQLLPFLKANWTVAYSEAQQHTPDMATYSTAHAVYLDSNHVEHATTTTLGSMGRTWQHNSDKDKTAKLDLTARKLIKGFPVEVQVGGLVRHKDRSNFYEDYSIKPVTTGGNPETFSSIDAAQFGLITPSLSNDQVNSYGNTEDIWGVYWQAKVNVTKQLEVLAGARTENTKEQFTTQMPLTEDGGSGTITYQDWLPSLHLKYALDKKKNIRASYFKSLTRPGFFEIIPYSIPGDNYTEIGNSNLKHTTADNYDLRYEWFPKGVDQLLAGVFYKNITNPIEYAYVRTGVSAAALQPANFGNAQNYGFDLSVAKYIKRFGVMANYNFTNSSITTQKVWYYRDASGNITNENINQTRPLQGQSKHIANISLVYKDTKHGFDAQLAWVYTGKKIEQLSLYYGLDYWARATNFLDFSTEKKINKHFSVYAKVHNILNTKTIVEILQSNPYQSGASALPLQERSDRILVQQDYSKQSFYLGIKYKF